MAIEREVAGLRCGEVLTELSDYLDGELSPERQAQVAAHLQDCDVCERFGSAFTIAIQSLRQGEPSLPGQVQTVFERLQVRLARSLDSR